LLLTSALIAGCSYVVARNYGTVWADTFCLSARCR